MSTINKVAHGLSAGQRVVFSDVVPTGTGIDEDAIYFVISAGLTADAFQISETEEGTALTLNQNITSASMTVVPETDDSDTFGTDYIAITAPSDVMAPPADPATPSDPSVTSTTVEDADGTTVSRLIVTFTPPSEEKLRAFYVQVTFVNDGDPVSPQPVWDSNAVIYTVPPDATSLAIDGVPGNVQYWVRCWTESVYGQVSAASGAATVVSWKDTSAPSIPTDLMLVADFNAAYAKWSPTTAKDLAFYEIRHAPDNGTGTAPDTAQWTYLRNRTTSVYVGGLIADADGDKVAEKRYWFQVRAVDTSGNVQDKVVIGSAAAATNLVTTTSAHGFVAGDPVKFSGLTGGTGLDDVTTYYVIASGLTTTELKVSTTVGGSEVDITADYTALTVSAEPSYRDFNAYPEIGWSVAVSVNPTLIAAEDIGLAQINPSHIDYLSADKIKTGDLTINTTDANLIDGIKVKVDTNADNIADTLVGLWNESGLYVYSQTDATDYIHLNQGGLTVYKDGVPTSAITPDGIDATAVRFGRMPGGHNLLLNSGFEVAEFSSSTPTPVTWDVSGDWTGTNVSSTNLSTGGSLTMTGVSF